MLTLKTFLIVCPLCFIGGCIDGISGGGGFVSLPSYMLAGLPPHFAIATNKVSAGMGTIAACSKYYREGYFRLRDSLPAALGAACGAYFGARLALMISSDNFRIVILILVPLTAAYTMLGHPFEERHSDVDLTSAKTRLLMFLTSAAVGVYDGFYGPASTTFMFLLLCAAAHLPVRSSAGIARVGIIGTMCCSLVVYFINGKVALSLGIVAGLFSMAGNYIGANMFKTSGVRLVKPVMLIVLTVFFIKTLLEVI